MAANIAVMHLSALVWFAGAPLRPAGPNWEYVSQGGLAQRTMVSVSGIPS